ncbi:MAG: FAD:protein FMN transferase [Candidatus Brocadiia bacterium]
MTTAIVLVGLGLGVWAIRGRLATVPAQNRLAIRRAPGADRRYETRFPAMGTDVRLVVRAESAEAARPILEAATGPISAVEARMSTYRPDSDVSRLNRMGGTRGVQLSPETMTVIRRAVEFSRMTGGAFDITYAPLRTLWRDAAESRQVPDQERVREALQVVGWEKLLLADSSVRFQRSGMEVDLGGIAKGYAIDGAAEAMKESGALSGLVDIGGDVRLFGRAPAGGRWHVAVRSPGPGASAIILRVPSSAVTTSGDYARGFRIGDAWFSHIVDPRTGRPTERMASVTVVAPDAMTGDALSTALSVLGPEEGLKLVESLSEVECMFVVREGEQEFSRRLSSGFSQFLAESR